MYIKSLYPDPPQLPNVNAHYIFFKRPDQAEWPNFTVHVDPVASLAEANVSAGGAFLSYASRALFRPRFMPNTDDLTLILPSQLPPLTRLAG